MRLEYHPSTASDLNRAIKFYDGQRLGLGAECRAAVYDAIDQIKNAPRCGTERSPEIYSGFLCEASHSQSCIALSTTN